MAPGELVIIRGGGDIASGIAHRLHGAGFSVLILEIAQPLVVRRRAAFARAVYEDRAEIEGVHATLARNVRQAFSILHEGEIAVLIDPEGKAIDKIRRIAVVDATLAKKNLGTKMDMAGIVIGVGPGFTAGSDVHAVVETFESENILGRVIYTGAALPDTGVPGERVAGYADERVIRAVGEGEVRVLRDIGSTVKKGDVLCVVDGKPVLARIDGMIRGMIQSGRFVTDGLKIGDIDPRIDARLCHTISDKARAVGGGVLEAVCRLSKKKKTGQAACSKTILENSEDGVL